MSAPAPISISGATAKPVDGYAVGIRTNTTQLRAINPYEPYEQIRAANERASAATAEAVQMSAAARETNATLGRVMHVLRGVVTFPDVQHTADPELPPEVRETLDKVLELVARRAKDV